MSHYTDSVQHNCRVEKLYLMLLWLVFQHVLTLRIDQSPLTVLSHSLIHSHVLGQVAVFWVQSFALWMIYQADLAAWNCSPSLNKCSSLWIQFDVRPLSSCWCRSSGSFIRGGQHFLIKSGAKNKRRVCGIPATGLETWAGLVSTTQVESFVWSQQVIKVMSLIRMWQKDLCQYCQKAARDYSKIFNGYRKVAIDPRSQTLNLD